VGDDAAESAAQSLGRWVLLPLTGIQAESDLRAIGRTNGRVRLRWVLKVFVGLRFQIRVFASRSKNRADRVVNL
jgi:hypothetical protein